MKQKLLKFIKKMQTFNRYDLESIIEDENFELQKFLDELINEKIITIIGEDTYAYVTEDSKPKQEVKFKFKRRVTEWLIINCNKDLNNLTVENIDPDKFFTKRTEAAFYKTCSYADKEKLIKNYTVLKLGWDFSGKYLAGFLLKLSLKYPRFKMSYSSYIHKKRKFKNSSIKLFLKNSYEQRQAFNFPDEVFEAFEKLYFTEKKYTVKYCAELLKGQFDPIFVPSTATLSRYMHCKYSNEEILSKKNNIPQELVKKFYTINKKVYVKNQLFYKCALDYIEKEKDYSTLCTLRNHILPYFKDFKINNITAEEAMKFQSKKIEDGYTIGNVQNMMEILNKIYKKYSSDANGILMKYGEILPILETSVLNNNQIKKIIKDRTLEIWPLAIGITPQELGGLTYTDIDFEKQTVHINKVYQHRSLRQHRQLYQMRTVKMHPFLLDTLQHKEFGIVFENVSIKDANVLLNTHVKLMLENNVPIPVISKNMGYRNLDDFTARFGFLIKNNTDEVDIFKNIKQKIKN